MNDFNPGDGWREIDGNSPSQPGREVLVLRPYGALSANENRYWVRVEEVPPLPTESGAVIQWQDGAYLPQIAQLDPGNRHLGWWAPDDHGDPRWMTAAQLQRRIGSDKWTLLEPRAVTAKAVLDRVREALPLGADRFSRDHLTLVAREFGVES